MHDLLTEKHIDSYARDGAVFIKGLFADHVDDIKKGIVRFFVDMYDEEGESVAIATILTMVKCRNQD